MNRGRSKLSCGFTLVEAVISMGIVSVMLVAALNTVSSARLSHYRTSLGCQGQAQAQALLAEILRQPYVDPDSAGSLGCETGESTQTREEFDDVDDFAGWSASPLQDAAGNVLTGTENWRRTVTVEWVSAEDPSLISAQETQVKRVTVVAAYKGVPMGTCVGLATHADLLE